MVEPATAGDLEAIKALVRENECLMAVGKEEGNEDLLQIGAAYVENVLATEMASWESLQQRFEPTGCRLWALKEEGRVMGCIGIVRGDRNDMELVRMYVDQSCRRRGFGRLLVSTLLEHVKSLMVKRVTLTTPSANRRGISFYENIGFTFDKTLSVTSSGRPLELSQLVMAVPSPD